MWAPLPSTCLDWRAVKDQVQTPLRPGHRGLAAVEQRGIEWWASPLREGRWYKHKQHQMWQKFSADCGVQNHLIPLHPIIPGGHSDYDSEMVQLEVERLQLGYLLA